MSHVVSHVITWRARGHVIGHVCSHGHVTGRSHLITCVLTITCASDEQVRHTDGAELDNATGFSHVLKYSSPSSTSPSSPRFPNTVITSLALALALIQEPRERSR